MHKYLIDLSNIKAVIFDMDGTMIDNMTYHKRAWMEFAKRHGTTLTDEDFSQKFSGRKNDQILETFLEKPLTQLEIADYTNEKEAVYRELYAPDIQEVKGLTALIHVLTEKGIKLAIATTAPEKNREFVLEKLGLQHTFPVILGDEHARHGKPHPEIYLETANKLHVLPSECLVFEDTPVGVEAARNAGMRVIGLLTRHSRSELQKAESTITDFTSLLIT